MGADLEAFTKKRFPGREVESDGDNGESAAELRRRLDDTLVEFGEHRALTEETESALAAVERILESRIAQLQHERDAAQDKAEEVVPELGRPRDCRLFGRLFGRWAPHTHPRP